MPSRLGDGILDVGVTVAAIFEATGWYRHDAVALQRVFGLRVANVRRLGLGCWEQGITFFRCKREHIRLSVTGMLTENAGDAFV